MSTVVWVFHGFKKQGVPGHYTPDASSMPLADTLLNLFTRLELLFYLLQGLAY
jgi:hypothetical protein